MADSVSKMVTPSEIFGIAMCAASKSTPAVHGIPNKAASLDKIERIPACSHSVKKSITSVEEVTSLSDLHQAVSGELVSWNRSEEGHSDLTKSLTSRDQLPETARQDRQEPLYYILARTGGSGDSSINTNTGDTIPLVLMGRQGQAKNPQTIALSMPPSTDIQSSTLDKKNDQKLPQNLLPQVVAMVPNLPRVEEHADHLSRHHRFQQQPANPTVTQGQTSLDPQWLRALANLLHLHVTNNGIQQQTDPSSSDSRLIPDEQLLSSLASSMDTSTKDRLSSISYRNGPESNPRMEKYSVSAVGGAPRHALAEIQPLGISRRGEDNPNSKQTQTLPRVLPHYTTKRQLVFVSPLMTQQDTQPKTVGHGDSGVLKNCTNSPPGKESDMPNWPSADENSMDTSDQNSHEVNDRHEAFTSECAPTGRSQGASQYLRCDLRARSSKTIPDALKKSESVLSLHSTNENSPSQRGNGSQCAMEADKTTTSANQLPRKTTPKVETMKSPTFSASPILNAEEARTVREKHNLKERKRRARIKEACDLMRQIVPGMSQKTDKATVFEFSARYIHFLKSQLGNGKDKDFLLKYSPY